MSPKHSIDFCPICGGGLCGIRVCRPNSGDAEPQDAQPQDAEPQFELTGSDQAHGLIVCDECEAIWLEPDLTTAHQYPDIDDARCPICRQSLWGSQSRWADGDDVQALHWEDAVNPDLDRRDDEGLA